MKLIKSLGIGALTVCLLATTACGTLSNTAKGGMIGGAGGAAVGAGLGAIIGKGKGAAIGAAIGTAVGAGAGVLIGHKMDKQKKELEEQLAQQAKIESVTDQNGLQAIKVTFDGGILFGFNKTSLTAQAKADLAKFATSLIQNPQTNVQVYGFTDNVGSFEANQKVANGRADAVKTFLINNGVAANRISAVGLPMQDYVASNDTEAGRAQNRRVEVYITANEQMIQEAQQGK